MRTIEHIGIIKTRYARIAHAILVTGIRIIRISPIPNTSPGLSNPELLSPELSKYLSRTLTLIINAFGGKLLEETSNQY